MRPNPDRPEFAVNAETQLALRCMFIDVYIEAEDFCAELVDLAEGFNGPALEGNVPWGSVKRQAPDWELIVSQFCGRWGLTFADKAAEQAVHWWCMERRKAGDQFKPGNLINGFHAGFNLLPHDIAPPVDCWDPTRERRAAAEARLRKKWEDHLKAELDRIIKAHEELASTTEEAASTTLSRRPYNHPRAVEHLRWLFKRQALHLSSAKIAQGPPVADQAAVRMACGRLAGDLDLILWRRADKSL